MTKEVLSLEIGQSQNAKRVPGGTKVRDYHKFGKASVLGYGKEWTDPEQPSEEYITKSIVSLRAILGIDIVWKEKINWLKWGTS